MAVFEVSVNLASSLYPFASEMWGRSVMIPQYDENYNRTIFTTIDPGFEKDTPQVFYMHNCMPTVQGYQSIGYDTAIPSQVTPTQGDGVFGSFAFGTGGFGNIGNVSFIYDKCFTIQTALGNNFLFVPAAGLNFIYNANVGYWVSTSPFSAGTVPNNVQVTTALVDGQTYIYYANYGCFIYDEIAGALTPVTLTGLDPTQILSICSANGYMIAASNNAVAWSSTVTVTDFTPSIVTGAGGGSINDAKGPISVALQITGGFIVYCQYNAVGATYTGNTSFPFIFLEVAGSGGLTNIDQISWHANMATHIMWGTYGVQELTKTFAKPVYPEATDFLAAKLFEDFDEDTLTFSSQYLVSPLAVKLVIIEGRYLVLSIAVEAPTYTHALIYDMTLKRWGKLKITHSCCFEWNQPNTFGITTYGQLNNTTYAQLSNTTYGELTTQSTSVVLSKKSIAFLQGDGTVKILNFDLSESEADGVFMIGKYQFSRSYWVEHQYGIIDTINTTNSFQYFIIPTYDGKTLKTPVPAHMNTHLSGAKTQTYQKRVTGVNISILFIGAFSLSTFLIGLVRRGHK